MKRHIIRAAAELIKADIKSLKTSTDVYPDPNTLRSSEDNLNYLPDSLRTLLNDIITGKSSEINVAAIGQCIIQVTRPRVVISPLPFGLGVQMHHQFGSRFLIDTLYSLGFSVSYSEVLNFERSAACFKGTDVLADEHFGMYVADNVDHNLRTLDGHGTFHGMGLIVAATPASNQRQVVTRIPPAHKGI